MLAMKKSVVWVTHAYLSALIEFPMRFIRKLVFTVSKYYYGRPEKIPLNIIHFCFPLYNVQDVVSKNGMMISYVVGQLARIHNMKPSDFRLWRSWNRLIIECKLISDEDYEDLFKVLSSEPGQLFTNILDHAMKHGDIDVHTHQHRVLYEPRYRQHLADIRDVIRLGVG